MSKQVTVRGHWRKNPKTGQPVWVHEHTREYKEAQPKEKAKPVKKPIIRASGRLLAGNVLKGLAEQESNHWLEAIYNRDRKHPKSMDQFFAGHKKFYDNLLKNRMYEEFATNPIAAMDKLDAQIKEESKYASRDFKDGYKEARGDLIRGIQQHSGGDETIEGMRRGIIEYSIGNYLATLERNAEKALRDEIYKGRDEFITGIRDAANDLRNELTDESLGAYSASLYLMATNFYEDKKSKMNYYEDPERTKRYINGYKNGVNQFIRLIRGY